MQNIGPISKARMPHCRQIHGCLLEKNQSVWLLLADGSRGPKGLYRDHLEDIFKNLEKNNSCVKNNGSQCRTTWKDVGNAISDGWGWGSTPCAREGNGKKEAVVEIHLSNLKSLP